ncbi:MAG TPA: tryptophan--tRNA ligase [Candidatus Eisenbacteria bacterium]|nr:tryptophan--tRNA ligase [Candidatus Eisenbacteria bacterium]
MDRVLSGMRPTGPLHLGHLLGALENWVRLQENHECFFMVADLHALMGEYENPAGIRRNSREMVVDWLACGIDPKKSAVFIQSQIPEHAELALILGMMTPLGWLERNPTYKEQLREIEGRDLTTYGFLGYPVLQAADILLYKANRVPVGEDQLAHLELSREIVRRFKHFYKKDVFPEPQPMLTKEARILGLDKRKMSKSYGNAIQLSDSEDTVRQKVLSMVSDTQRARKTDPGHPDECFVHYYLRIFADADLVQKTDQWCLRGEKGCHDTKGILADVLLERLKPMREKRARLAADPAEVEKVLKDGYARASEIAKRTLSEVKDLVGL